ncbi:MAG: DEAD/DEAH box helicase [Chloroflexi bacterium]|nr:DEAD/DEAH box helicase [Chloroflexota bacterium]
MSTLLQQLAQPDDRWDVTDAVRRVIASGDRARRVLQLDPSWDLFFDAEAPVTLVMPDGRILAVQYDHDQHALHGPGMTSLVTTNDTWHLVLESSAPLRFSLRAELLQKTAFVPGLTTERGVRLSFTSDDDLALLTRPPASQTVFALSQQAAIFAASPGFDELLSLPLLRDVELFPHQLKTARTVLRRFRGRALLCDEVGLGKTIEAGMILLELLMRKLVRRVLILTPSSLVEQWRGEMSRKFGLDFIAQDDEVFKELGEQAWASVDHILASYHKVRREPYRSLVAGQEWDMVIVDEAHHFRNRNTVLWKFANSLRKKYILLLTATPIQNNLEELYNLVTLLQPGLLSTARRFQQQFVDRHDKLTPRNLEQLHGLLAEAMVRNRRSNVTVGLTRRFAHTLVVEPSPEEKALYDEVTGFVRSHLRDSAESSKGAALSRMALITLQKELGSSSMASAATLARLAENKGLRRGDANALHDLALRAGRQHSNAKVDQLLKLLADIPDKMVIFTQFRRTQDVVSQALAQAGERVAVFHGALTRMEKEAAVQAFQGEARVLVSTESGSEGRNLQFCHALCNFDLPWNPMRIEQRIGRLSRIGQTRDVHVFNLTGAGTIEADILRLLEAKINLFELVIGEVEMILGNLDEEREFEDIVFDLWSESANDAQFRERMDALGNQMVQAKQAYLTQAAYEDRIFGKRFAPEG